MTGDFRKHGSLRGLIVSTGPSGRLAMSRSLFPITLTTRRKLTSALVAMAIFTCLGALTTAAVGRPVEIGTTNAALIGLGVGLFEEFYVQSQRGDWLRAMHPLRSIPVYVAVVIVLYFISVHLAHLDLGRLDDLPTVYRRLPYGLTFFTLFSMVGILMMRVVHFIGLGTLFHLMVGTYHRPVGETWRTQDALVGPQISLRGHAADHRPSWRDLSLQGRWVDRDVGLDGGHR